MLEDLIWRQRRESQMISCNKSCFVALEWIDQALSGGWRKLGLHFQMLYKLLQHWVLPLSFCNFMSIEWETHANMVDRLPREGICIWFDDPGL